MGALQLMEYIVHAAVAIGALQLLVQFVVEQFVVHAALAIGALQVPVPLRTEFPEKMEFLGILKNS